MAAFQPIKIIIADDHPMIRQMLNLTIKDIPELKIIGEAASGNELIQLSKKLKPDIIITDIKMPDINGIEVTKQLTKELPDSKIIALSMIDDEHIIINMLEAGAKGYLLKDVFVEEVIISVKAVYNNETYLSKSVSGKIAKMVAKGDYTSYKNLKSKLSEKEVAVIKLICQEKSSKQISDQLGISKKAVDGLRDTILKKTDVKNTAGLVVYAIKNKIC